MMWEIPTTAGLFLIGFWLFQKNHYDFLERQKNLDKTFNTSSHLTESITLIGDQVVKLGTEFTEIKKRVDVLTLKAGFKL